jgi:rhodanese-related sulfurtransferase
MRYHDTSTATTKEKGLMSAYPWGENNEALPAQVAAALATENPPSIVDVRTSREFEARHIPGALSVPMDCLASRVPDLDCETTYVLVCEHGVRSRACAAWLLQQGIRAVNMIGGMASYTGPTEAGPAA